MPFPPLFRVRQKFNVPSIKNVEREVERELARLELGNRVRPGQSIAVTFGSRGVSNIALITRTIVRHLLSLGAEPFLVPAMGSHGGGTPEGQRKVVETYGATEEYVGCPIRSCMETIEVGRTDAGVPIHFDRLAFEADGVFVCNRVKAHTRFAGPHESGLLKMLLVGLGKAAGAQTYHTAFQDGEFSRLLPIISEQVLSSCSVIGGLGIVENARDETARIEAARPDEFIEKDRTLLALAKKWMARLPFDRADLLIIDEIGKDISGTGLDSNVVGRKFDDHKAVEGETPRISTIAVRDLTDATCGNANGMGMTEFCRTSMLEKVDFKATRFNAITANHATAAMTPLDYASDQEMIAEALRSFGIVDASQARILWITNTLQLEEVECSPAFWEEAQAREDLEILSELRAIPLDEDGNLPARMSQL